MRCFRKKGILGGIEMKTITRLMVMQNGKIVEQGPVADVLTNPKTEYTKRLVRAVFEIAA
jgi:ABC-type microcin C transport system duplicated ATPase subunit YejF